jgi:hypothetical protein
MGKIPFPKIILAILIVLALAGISILLYPPFDVKRTEDPVKVLKNRLVQLGIPVFDVKVLNPTLMKKVGYSDQEIASFDPSKLSLLIILKSQLKDESGPPFPGSPAFEDFWSEFVANHEIRLASLNIGQPVDVFAISFTSDNGKSLRIRSFGSLGDTSNSISQQFVTPELPRISEQAIKEQLAEKLDLKRLGLITMEVETDHIARKNTRYVYLQVAIPDTTLERMNQTANRLSGELHDAVDELNSRFGAQISITRLQVTDSQKRPVAEYIYNPETFEPNAGSHASMGIKGVDIGWFMIPPAATEAPTP